MRMPAMRILIGVAVAALALLDVRAAESVKGLLFSESFDDSGLASRGWYDTTRFEISREKPLAGAGSVEYGWKEKGGAQVVSGGARRLFTPADTVYLRFYLRLSSNWGWSGRSYHPHLIYLMTTENEAFRGPASSHLTLYVEPVGGKLRLAAQDIQNADATHGLTQGPLRGGYNGTFYDSADVLFKDDKWHCVEAMFGLNAVDAARGTANADGIARAWFDGALVVDRTDVVYRSADFPAMKINQLLIGPYFGPGLVPHPQSLWIDELALGTERIGRIEKTAE